MKTQEIKIYIKIFRVLCQKPRAIVGLCFTLGKCSGANICKKKQTLSRTALIAGHFSALKRSMAWPLLEARNNWRRGTLFTRWKACVQRLLKASTNVNALICNIFWLFWVQRCTFYSEETIKSQQLMTPWRDRWHVRRLRSKIKFCIFLAAKEREGRKCSVIAYFDLLLSPGEARYHFNVWLYYTCV